MSCCFPEVLEEALVGCDPEGPLCELLFFFLSAIFQALAEEEEEVAREQLTEADAKGRDVAGLWFRFLYYMYMPPPPQLNISMAPDLRFALCRSNGGPG